jgi:hypothetical protein
MFINHLRILTNLSIFEQSQKSSNKVVRFEVSTAVIIQIVVFCVVTPSRPALEPTQPPIQRAPETVSPKIKRQGREADQSSSATAEIKNTWSNTSHVKWVSRHHGTARPQVADGGDDFQIWR